MKIYNKNNINLARNLRKNMTPQEKKLWYQFLNKTDVRFQRQKCIENYIEDFYCAKKRLVIEIDGGGHYTEENIENDKIRTKVLNNLNIKVIRFKNKDIDDDFVNVCNYILSLIK